MEPRKPHEVKKVGKSWYIVNMPGIDAEIVRHKHTDFSLDTDKTSQAGYRVWQRNERNRLTITGRGAKSKRDEIAKLLLEHFPEDFPGGITF